MIVPEVRIELEGLQNLAAFHCIDIDDLVFERHDEILCIVGEDRQTINLSRQIFEPGGLCAGLAIPDRDRIIF